MDRICVNCCCIDVYALVNLFWSSRVAALLCWNISLDSCLFIFSWCITQNQNSYEKTLKLLTNIKFILPLCYYCCSCNNWRRSSYNYGLVRSGLPIKKSLQRYYDWRKYNDPNFPIFVDFLTLLTYAERNYF